MPSKEQIINALKDVIDPELGRDIVTLGMVRDVEVSGGEVKIKIVLTTPACPLKNIIKKSTEDRILSIEGVTSVKVELGSDVPSSKERSDRLPGVRNILAIGSGKGGVGKSTVSVNLSVALGQMGARVGLLDADLYGPSIPIMMGLRSEGLESEMKEGREVIIPTVQFGIKVFSMGLLLRETDAVIWRGPLLHKALQQFVEDVDWGDLDYLIIDLPPGTGDVQISLTQLVPITSAIVVTTPQDVAFADVLRAVKMFEVTKIPVLGIIENMAIFVCPNCGREHHIFGYGHVEQRANQHKLPYLGALPLDIVVSPTSDNGVPIVIAAPNSSSAKAFVNLASIVASRLSIANLSNT